MGGQALKIAKTRRYQAEEYFKLVPEVESLLDQQFSEVHVVQAYRNKPSFGDMDILVKAENIHFNVEEWIQAAFHPKEIARNSHVYSFDYKELQIDIILVKPKYWETSIVYYSYNDLGNLMGRVANRMGLKYGHFGLAYKHTHNGRGYGDLPISQDLPMVFKYLGFDWNRYSQGFAELEDVFEFVISSRYFTPQIFDYENLDHQNRTRTAKRKTYQAFLDYLVENADRIPKDESYVHYKKETNMATKDWDRLKHVDQFFGSNTVQTIEVWNARIAKKEQVAEKFNGKILMEKYDLQGKELGDSIAKFKKQFVSENAFDDFVLGTHIEMILKRFERVNKILQVGTNIITLDPEEFGGSKDKDDNSQNYTVTELF